MPSATLSAIPGRERKNILSSKARERKSSHQHGKMRNSTFEERKLQDLIKLPKPSLPSLGASARRKDKKSRGICTIKSVKISSSPR